MDIERRAGLTVTEEDQGGLRLRKYSPPYARVTPPAGVSASAGAIPYPNQDGAVCLHTRMAGSANASHGLRRINDDKRRAVMTLLNDGEWVKWSDREIARRAGVSQPTVSAIRKELSDKTYQMPSERLVERNGVTYLQNTANIGNTERLQPVIMPSSSTVAVLSVLPAVVRQTRPSASLVRR